MVKAIESALQQKRRLNMGTGFSRFQGGRMVRRSKPRCSSAT